MQKKKKMKIKMNKDFEVLFFELNFLFMCGKYNEAATILEMLRDIQQKDENAFYLLDEQYKSRLKRIAHYIDNSIPSTRLNDVVGEDPINIQTDTDIIKKEKDLVKLICQSGAINNYIDNNFRFENLEHPTEYGRIDIFGTSNEVVYPIEVKLGKATHSIISQIEKYCCSLWKKLILKLWKDVRGVVIAKSFDNYVLQELKKMDVLAYVYLFKRGELRLVSVV